MTVKPIPEGYHTVTPYVMVQGLSSLLGYLKEAFHAKETERIIKVDGTIGHAEIQIGDSVIMFAEARGDWPAQPASFYLYISDTDKTYERAIKAGGVSLMEPADQYYGDRNAGVKDPSGNSWWIATRFEDVSPVELQRRENERAKDQQ